MAADNSLEAFELAIDIGADMIEFDVRRTADDQLIAFHDQTIGERSVANLSRSEIADLTGSAPPLFDEILTLTRERIMLDIELKEHGYVPRVLDEIRTHAMQPDQVVITSFVDEVVREVKELAPATKCGLLLGVAAPEHGLRTRVSELLPVRRAKACRADFVAPYARLARLGVLSRASAAGFSAYVWTVNEPRELKHFLADRRVAAGITDDVALAIELRNESQALAPAA